MVTFIHQICLHRFYRIIIRIYDNQGKLIAYHTSKESSLSLNVEKFKKGIYLIDVSTNTGSFKGKFVKE